MQKKIKKYFLFLFLEIKVMDSIIEETGTEDDSYATPISSEGEEEDDDHLESKYSLIESLPSPVQKTPLMTPIAIEQKQRQKQSPQLPTEEEEESPTVSQHPVDEFSPSSPSNDNINSNIEWDPINEPLQEIHRGVKVVSYINGIASKDKITIHQLDGNTPEEVFEKRHDIIKSLLPKLTNVQGAEELVARICMRLIPNGDHSSYEEDRNYLSALLVMDLQMIVRHYQLLMRKIQETQSMTLNLLFDAEQELLQNCTLLNRS